MTASGPTNPEPADLSELPVPELLALISSDHTEATEAGKTQGARLKEMGRKLAALRAIDPKTWTWRRIEQETGIPTRTAHRYAKDFLPPKT